MPTWLIVLGGVLAGLVALSTLVLVVRGAWKEGKIAELRADNDDLRKRDTDRIKEINDLREKSGREIADLRDREEALELRVVDLERDKKTLMEAATNAGKIEILNHSFEAHRKAVQQRQGEIISKIDRALVLLAQRPA